jgi:hypothetical protein
MVIATKKVQPASPSPQRQGERTPSPSLIDRFARVIDAIYRFLASLKLAVISLLTLAITLGYATLFESWYGTAAVQEWIYKSPAFVILLAFLGMNILCAALVRFPWKKRQIGFVITHTGLLTILAGSYSCLRTSDEGQVGMLEGSVKNEMVRRDHPVIRIWEVDPHTRERSREIDLAFQPGAFQWGPGKPRNDSVVNRLISGVSLGLSARPESYQDVLSQPGDPFRFVVKEYLPASAGATAHIVDRDGSPMVRIGLQFKGPNMPQAQDALRSEAERWLATEKKFYRVVRNQRPAMIVFSYVNRSELVDDFLKPPFTAGASGVARFRYPDRAGRVRSFDWVLDDQKGKSTALPESDLTVTLSEVADFPTSTGRLDQFLGDDAIPIAVFKIQAGKAEPVTHMALANMPMVPNLIPSTDEATRATQQPLAAIHYMTAPAIDPKTNGRFGQIEILAGPDDALYYRVFGRGKETKGELRAAGTVEKGKPIAAFGGGATMPMTITFEVDEYLPSAIEKQIYEPIELPKGKLDEGLAACRAEMTVGKETRDFWLQRSMDLEPPPPRYVTFENAVYEVRFDADRRPLGFELKLIDFEVGFEPGTEQATKFESQVELTDPSSGIKKQAHTISMNHPLDHRGFTFYQSRYMPDIDPETNQPTGRFESVFQVATNPARPVIYLGCVLVVLGAFTQFYMRAGIFTDGGKRERERAAAKARKRLAKEHDQPQPSRDNELL